jgi:glycosyltransferase involved in cell wall biosynthesis
MDYNVIFFSGLTSPNGSQLTAKVRQVSTGQYDILTHPSRLKAMAQGIWNKKAAVLLQQLLDSLDPTETIVHLQGFVKVLSPSVGKVLNDSGFPVVFTLHDYFAICPNGGLYNFKKNEVCHLRPMSVQCICTNCDARQYSHKLWRVARQAAQNSLGGIPRRLKHFITVSEFSEKLFRPYLPKEANIYRISNPILSPMVASQRANVHNRRLLVIGRISAEKGVQLACEAARKAGIPLTVIGEGEQKQLLQQQYPEVDFKGWLSPAQVYDEMVQASALVFPSIWYETQGLVVLEALSVGLPVIVSDGSAASDYVDGKNGVTFQSNNLEDLVQKIDLLTSSMERLDEMSQYAWASYWKQPFTPDEYIEQLLKTYLSILNRES